MDFSHAVFVLECDLEGKEEWISSYKQGLIYSRYELKKLDDELGELIKQFNKLIKKRKKLINNIDRDKEVLRQTEESHSNLRAAMDILRAASDK